ncbi:uncharacterized protein BYT42DRAFT_614213 [Radiomyces spectabilis]|uniref:uncharacterized protein n=1 Tax=Radiomyces spectabilis TaxID=64574 RepID=UPI00221EE332|nr:uncharacterized protein BYT42DRAFT_614213 [Radiomyces spectabilis]KAI8377541.1 hypothetical protein BYT42DRAFT_614213 [Radiomyces spectabilis]
MTASPEGAASSPFFARKSGRFPSSVRIPRSKRAMSMRTSMSQPQLGHESKSSIASASIALSDEKEEVIKIGQRWETYFEPRFSFGSQAALQAKQPLEQPVIHKQENERDPEPEALSLIMSSAPTPTLPPIDQLKLLMPTQVDAQVEILPCPSRAFLSNNMQQRDHQQKWRERMDLLHTIHNQGFREANDATLWIPKAAAWQSLKAKAEQIKRDAKNPFYHPPEEPDDAASLAENGEKKQSTCRRSFHYFVWGFLFPPLWVAGALYVSPHIRTSTNWLIDQQWKRRSRNAFACFLVVVAMIMVFILALKPSALGWRTSNIEGFEDQVLQVT